MSNPGRYLTAARDIGSRVRTARLGAGLTLAHLAERTNLSESFLSRVERGQVSSSIANLIQITEVLGLGLHELFVPSAPPRTAVAVHRLAGSELAEIAVTGYRWRYLAGGAPLDDMEVFHLILPRRERMKTMVSHPGQEHCYVLSGEVVFYVGEEKHRLRAGEGIFIDSGLPHRAENGGKGEAEVLMTVSKTGDRPVLFDWWRPAAATFSSQNASAADDLAKQQT